MIKNIQPKTLVIGSIEASYTKAYIHHSVAIDEDVEGKVFWTTPLAGLESAPIEDEDHSVSFRVLDSLQDNIQYSVKGAFYDSMVDSSLRIAQSGMSISAPYIFVTKEAPSITSITQTSTQVDIGVTDPILTFELAGDATSYILEYSIDAGVTWVTVATSSASTFSLALPMGDYLFRASGTIILPAVSETSTPVEYSGGSFTVVGGSSQPNAATGLSASIGRIQATFERFDVRLSWTWDRGTAGNIKEFLVKGYPTGSTNDFDTPTILTSAGTSLSHVLIDIPKDVEYTFRVDALGYNDTMNSSTPIVLTITDANIDEDYEKGSGVEITYAGIKGYTIDGPTYTQSFSIDAATGAVAIGYVDPVEGAPIRFDPVSELVTVNGSVIADNITSASFVMAQLTVDDRPHIRTTNKTNYGDGNSGLYMGYNNSVGSPEFQFDMGNSSDYIRWDGSTMYVSGGVRLGAPGDSVPFSEVGLPVRFYNQSIVSFGGTFNGPSATAFVLNELGTSIVPEGTVVTQYNSVDVTISDSAEWDGAAWVVPAVFLNGNLLATGSIAGDRIKANTITGDNISADSRITVGDTADRYAFISGNDGTDAAIAAGVDTSSGSGATAPFRVGHNGDLYAENASITGEVNATSGSISNLTATNITIDETCTVNGDLSGASGSFSGTVYANKIEGDVANYVSFKVAEKDYGETSALPSTDWHAVCCFFIPNNGFAVRILLDHLSLQLKNCKVGIRIQSTGFTATDGTATTTETTIWSLLNEGCEVSEAIADGEFYYTPTYYVANYLAHYTSTTCAYNLFRMEGSTPIYTGATTNYIKIALQMTRDGYTSGTNNLVLKEQNVGFTFYKDDATDFAPWQRS